LPGGEHLAAETGGEHLPAETDHTQAGTYTVRAGDTLSGIAARLRIVGGWPALYELNRSVIGPDPNLILRGQVLQLP
jgi:nucleoid-associated protein YgaU